MKSILFSIAAFTFLLVMTGCANTKPAPKETEALFRNDWKLTELQGQVLPDSTISTLQFSPGRVSGHTGCNRVSANFTPGRKQTILFSPQVVTKMACPDENAAAIEAKFLDALSRSTNWSMSGGELRLGDGQTTLIKMKAK